MDNIDLHIYINHTLFNFLVFLSLGLYFWACYVLLYTFFKLISAIFLLLSQTESEFLSEFVVFECQSFSVSLILYRSLEALLLPTYSQN